MGDVADGNWNFTRQRQGPDKGYASGKWAVAMCDRCGWKKPWKSLSTEPGTNWKVCSDCNDYGYSLVAHPQNYSADVKDAIALRWARPDQNPAITQPYYLADESGYVLVWDQDYIIQTGTSAASGNTLWPNQLNWQSPPFGYES